MHAILHRTMSAISARDEKVGPIMANQNRGSTEDWSVKAYSVSIQPARLKKPAVHVYENPTKYRDTSKFGRDTPQCHLPPKNSKQNGAYTVSLRRTVNFMFLSFNCTYTYIQV